MKTHEVEPRPARHRGPRREDPTGLLPRREGKVQSRHLDRLAIVYVRQSSPQQVQEHRESGRLQYDLRGRAAPRRSAGRRTGSSSSTRARDAAARPPRAAPGSSGPWPGSGSTASG